VEHLTLGRDQAAIRDLMDQSVRELPLNGCRA
jgi:hypothetical protein